MSPALRPGDLVEIKEAFRERLCPGQILVVNRNNTLICHRLARIFEDEAGRWWVVTRPEKSTVEDPPVAIEQVVGKVTRVLPPRLFHQVVWHLKRWGGNLFGRRPFRFIFSYFSVKPQRAREAGFPEGPAEKSEAKRKG